MTDARPWHYAIQWQACGFLGFVAWWWLQGAPRRMQCLTDVFMQERLAIAPPVGFAEQLLWLGTQRLPQLLGLLGWLGVVGLIAGVEGHASRTRDTWAGVRLWTWTLSLVGAMVFPGVVVALLLSPWPLRWDVVAGVWALALGVVSFGLGRGRPTIP